MNKDGDGWRRFLTACAKVRDPGKLDEFFDLFLTFEERAALAGRYLVVESLLKGKKSQREIAHDLKVSISKITRGSNSLKSISEGLRSFLARRMT